MSKELASGIKKYTAVFFSSCSFIRLKLRITFDQSVFFLAL